MVGDVDQGEAAMIDTGSSKDSPPHNTTQERRSGGAGGAKEHVNTVPRVCHYATLGVGREATAGEIRAAYHTQARLLHPDRNGGNEEAAAERFKQVLEAYHVLVDPARRIAYDMHTAAARLHPAYDQAPAGSHAAPAAEPSASPCSPAGSARGRGEGEGASDVPKFRLSRGDLHAVLARVERKMNSTGASSPTRTDGAAGRGRAEDKQGEGKGREGGNDAAGTRAAASSSSSISFAYCPSPIFDPLSSRLASSNRYPAPIGCFSSTSKEIPSHIPAPHLPPPLPCRCTRSTSPTTAPSNPRLHPHPHVPRTILQPQARQRPTVQ
eukprot:TRINITY_DN4842_c0_g1_i1.p1 TRINITY_DN4842_c0_g1~~TRINITY_DN4842_c0_g1_i1.p1  ORF type:complete len:324 (-),score=61.33 TRINITY_DN4842_c0_g1_i1:66-1037(-)